MSDKYPVSEILTAFRFFDANYKQDYVDAAIEQKDEIIPHLIRILENVLSKPEEYVQDNNLYDHIYAFMLLGHFKAEDAHNVIADIFSLKDGIPDALFGDLITEDLPVILLNTCGGSLERIKSMILDKQSDEYCRISACRALAYAVVSDYISRKEAVEFFGELLVTSEPDEMSDFRSLLANVLVDLYPVEIMDVIRSGYENGRILPGIVSYEAFERSLKTGEALCLNNLRMDFESQNLDDLHKSMSWWACFDNASEKSSSWTADRIQEQRKRQKKKAAVKKKRRKQAKKSRKKNRR